MNMHPCRHKVVVLGLGIAALLSAAKGQSSPAVDASSVPSHSGKAAGVSGPKMTNPPPPAHQSTNPVNNKEDNSPGQSFVGLVSDSYCGRHHYMLSGANDTECTRYCIAHRGRYVLIAGGKLYTLENQPGHVLDALAGKKARITGALVRDNVIEVASAGPMQGTGK